MIRLSVALVLLLLTCVERRPVATPSAAGFPVAAPTGATAASPAASDCPVAPGWPSDGRLEEIGRYLRASFDGGKLTPLGDFLYVRLVVSGSAPRAARVQARARVIQSGSPLAVTGYGAGQPYAEFGSVSEGTAIAIEPCGALVLVVFTRGLGSGSLALTLPDIQLPESGSAAREWRATLDCATHEPGAEATCTVRGG